MLKVTYLVDEGVLTDSTRELLGMQLDDLLHGTAICTEIERVKEWNPEQLDLFRDRQKRGKLPVVS